MTRRVLYLVHGMPPEEFTGTPLVAHGYASDIVSHGWLPTVLYASGAVGSWDEVERLPPADEPYARIAVPPSHPTGYQDWAIRAASTPGSALEIENAVFEGVLEDLQPDLVHVVDNVMLPLDWPELAAREGVPVVRTVSCAEDLCALIAPVSSLSDPIGYCEGPITPEHCAACVAAEMEETWGTGAAPGASSNSALGDLLISNRRTRLVRGLERKRERARFQYGSVFERIVFSSAAFEEFFEATLPLERDRVRVVEMGVELALWSDRPPREAPPSSGPVVFALAATLDPVKGHRTVAEAFSRPELAKRDDYRLVLLGGGDASIAADLVANPNVEALGPYRPEDLPRLLARADVGLSTSRFETFHRVTREYLLAGMPVIANPTFGISGLIRDGVNGLLYDHRDPASLTAAVVKILDDPALRQKLADGVAATHVRSVAEEVEEIASLYEEVVEGWTNTASRGAHSNASATAETTRSTKEDVEP